MSPMDELDQKLNATFDGKVLRKDLLHRIKKGTNVPTFVLEFLLAKYCASNDQAEMDAGSLITGYDDKTQLADIAEKLDELKQSLLELDVELEVKLNPNIHDREIRLDNGWIIKIGRGLDFYQKPGGWFEVGANDLSLRKCLETKVDIFRA